MFRILKELRFDKGQLLRVLADVLFVNVAFGGSLLVRFFIRVTWERQPEDFRMLDKIADSFLNCYYLGAPWLTALTLFVFTFFGVYAHARFYARRHKAVVLFQAITLSYLLFLALLYFLLPQEIAAVVPRSVYVLSYLSLLALAGGTRLLKHYAGKRYDIVQRIDSSRRPIRRVLIVGGAGYIGSHLVRQLLARGYKVRVLDAAIYGNQSIADLAGDEDFEWVEGDLRHVEAVVRAVKGCDAIAHLGAIVGDPACELNAKSTVEINTITTKLLIQVSRGYGVQRMLFASTCALYGASDHLMDERSEINPVSLYSLSKAEAEKVVLEAKSKEFCPVALRLGTVFGHSHRPRFDLVVNLLTAKALKERKITIYNPDQWRPFVHVHDAARAFCLCLEAPEEVLRGEIFNVGSYAMNMTLGQLSEKVKALVPGTEVEIVESGDRRNYRVSFEKIRSYLGFVCERTVEDGIRGVVEYLKSESVEAFAEEIFDNSKTLRAISDQWLASPSDSLLSKLLDSPLGSRARKDEPSNYG